MSSDVLCGLLRWQLPVAAVRVRLPGPGREVQGVARILSWMRYRPSPMALASLAASRSSGGFSVAHSQKDGMSAARSAEIRESARPDSMIGIRAVAARRLSDGLEGRSGLNMPSLYRGAGQSTEEALKSVLR